MVAKNHGHLVSVASSAGLIGVNGLAGNNFINFIMSSNLLHSSSPARGAFWDVIKPSRA